MSRGRYVPPPSPPEACDTPESQRDWIADMQRAQDIYDAQRPTRAELEAEEQR